MGGNAVPAATNYPYTAVKSICKSTAKIPMNIFATVQNYTGGNEIIMKQIVANVGPIATAMSATSYFQLYKSGIFFDTSCDSNCRSYNHAIIIVGYGTDPLTKLDYWIIKNSWGKSWGQDGYAFMARNKGNNCNIACYAVYAL
ncbi:cathepsin S-like [Chironomus tepperi]|uniref:cathepsin S-like n=1 Tax=Chironomus tepperi TaxID=113505 RepID=UPI00391EFBF6